MAPVVLRAATRADLQRFYKGRQEELPTMIALVGTVEERIVGVGGVVRVAGRRVAFCDLTDEGRGYRLSIARAAKLVMGDMQARSAHCRGPVFVHAQIDPKEIGAERWLASLGFRPVPNQKGTYRWRA